MVSFLVFAGLFAGPQELPAGGVLTVDQAVAYADKYAFAVQLQQTRVEKQRQEMEAAAGALGPKATLSANYQRFDQATRANFGTSTFTILPIQTLYGQASVGLPIDISGNMHRLVRASKANLFAQSETLEANRADTRRTVRTAYYGVLRAQSMEKVADETHTSDAARAQNVEQKFKAGITAQVDLLRAQTQEAASESSLIAAQNAVLLAKQNLNNTLARPIETPFEVTDVPLPTTATPDPTALVATAQRQRHEAKALEHTVEALAFIRRAAEQGTSPSLALTLAYSDYAKPVGFGQRPQVATGIIALNFPVYDSGVTRANVKAARQDEEQGKIQLTQVKLEISLEVRQALTNLADAQSRLAVAGRQVGTAQVVLNQAQLRLGQGIGILLEVVDAQRDLTTAEAAQVAAKYDVLQATADLDRAVG